MATFMHLMPTPRRSKRRRKPKEGAGGSYLPWLLLLLVDLLVLQVKLYG